MTPEMHKMHERREGKHQEMTQELQKQLAALREQTKAMEGISDEKQLLTDVLGLEEIVDHVQVQEVLWEREERTKAVPATEPRSEREPYGTEDIVESMEEEVDYVPPVSPTPEEE